MGTDTALIKKPQLKIEMLGNQRLVFRLYEYSEEVYQKTAIMFDSLKNGLSWIRFRPEQEIRLQHIEEILAHTAEREVVVSICFPN